MASSKRALCKRGHPLKGENVYAAPNGDRECVACKRDRRLNRRRDQQVRAHVGYNFPKIKFCRRGHAVIGDNVTFMFSQGVRWIGCRTCERSRARQAVKRQMPSEEKVREVSDALSSGKTLNQITGYQGDRYVGGRIMKTDHLSNLFRNFPKLARRFRAMSEKNAANAREQIKKERILAGAPMILRAADNIMDVIEHAVPRHLSKDHRDDVIQNIWLAVMERRLKLSEIHSRAHEFIRTEYKVNHDAWGHLSLDVPIFLDSTTTLLDTATRGVWG